ncbi:MAG TPA: TadE family protein [Bryobacteraceae bacterium]|nr:TadE family protein [Bryobacteraceae bacterium]
MPPFVYTSKEKVFAVATGKRANQRGQSVIETMLLLPWLAFCFVGAFDLGIYSYAMISAENAARVVGMYASASTSVAENPTLACTYALAELKDSPGVGSTSSCSSGGVVNVSTTYLATGADGLPAEQVSVTYKPTQVIGLPGLINGNLTITRTVEFPIRGS